MFRYAGSRSQEMERVEKAEGWGAEDAVGLSIRQNHPRPPPPLSLLWPPLRGGRGSVDDNSIWAFISLGWPLYPQARESQGASLAPWPVLDSGANLISHTATWAESVAVLHGSVGCHLV